MKPRIFIGSSGSAKKTAAAIHACLEEVAECTVWAEGAFGLSGTTIDELMKNLRDSDFGIFVFAPDDVASIKGDLLNVVRDNVLYEAGPFGGYSSPKRCFILAPRTVKIHIPSDLLGMTLGHYEDDRGDGNYRAAVNTFCSDVEQQIKSQGLFDGHPHERLRELSTRFECCHWIKDEKERVARKNEIAAQIDSFCRTHPVNKHRLLAQNGDGRYIALLIAIRRRPEERDSSLILQMHREHLPPGFAYYHLMDAVEALKANKCCTQQELTALSS